jgi:hypothetical protein
MSLVRGTGSLTLRGLDIINYCNSNGVGLEFNEAYVTVHATPSFTSITDPNYILGLGGGASASEGISKEQVDGVLAASMSIVVPSSIAPGDKSYGTSSSILPLVVQLAMNLITTETALRLYYMFVKDPEGKRYTLGAGQGANFNIGDTVTAGGNSGNVIYVDGDIISVTHQSGDLTGAISGGSSFPGTGTISSNSDLYILFYMGCLLYDDSGPTISTLSVVPGMNMPIRTQIRFSSGFPDDVSFINTSISEIEVHNADPTSHDGTHLRLDGGNRPTTNINWDNNKLENLAIATDPDDATRYSQLRSQNTIGGPVSTSGVINNYFTSDSFPSFLNHWHLAQFDNDIRCYDIIGAGEDILISNLHGDSYYQLDLGGYDLEMGGIPFTTNNKSIITIRNCSANVKITNIGSGSVSTINMGLWNQSTLVFPDSDCAAIYLENCSGRIEIVTEDVGGNKGLIIDGDGYSSTVGIYAKNCSNVYVKGLEITDIGSAIISNQSHIVVDDCSSIASTYPANALVCLNGGKITYLRDDLTDTTQIMRGTNYDFRTSISAGSLLERLQVITLANATGFNIGGYICNTTSTIVGQIVDKKPDNIIYVHIIKGTQFSAGSSVDPSQTYSAPAATTISTVSTKYFEIYEALAQ